MTSLPDLDALWDYEHPDASEKAFRDLLPAARASGNRDALAQLLTQIARAEGLQMKFDDAARTLDEAESLLAPGLDVARVRVLLERGRVLRSSKQPDRAKPFFRQAWDLARAAGADRFAVDAAHMMALVEPADEADVWNRTAVDAAEASRDPAARRWLGSLYNNLGWTAHGRGDPTGALGLFQRALAAREAEGKPEPIRIARWCVARALRSLDRTDEALDIQQRLLGELEAAGSSDGYVHEEIGECLLARGRESDAAPHFASAHRLLASDPWLQRDEPDRLERLRRLGAAHDSAATDAR